MKPGIVGLDANGAVSSRRCLRPVRHQIRTPSVASPAGVPLGELNANVVALMHHIAHGHLEWPDASF